MTTPTMLNFTQLYGNGGQEYSPFPVIHIFETSTIHTFTHSGLAFIRALGAGAGGGLAVGGAGGWGQLLKNVSAGDELVCSIGAGGPGWYPGESSGAAISGGNTDITLHGSTYSAAGGRAFDDSTERLSSPHWDYCRHGRAAGLGAVDIGSGDKGAMELAGWGYRVDAVNRVLQPAPTSGSSSGFAGGIFMPGSNAQTAQYSFSGYQGGAGGKGAGGGLGERRANASVAGDFGGRGGAGGGGLVIVYFWPATNP